MRVVLAEDSGLLRDALKRLLSDYEIEVVQAVDTGPDLLRAVKEQRPDVSIVDVRLPPSFRDEGIRAAMELRRGDPDAHVLVLSQHVEERYARDLIAAGTAGLGYLLKDRVVDGPEFAESLRRVAAGGTALDPEVVRQLLVRRRRIDELSAREREVLSLMAEGRSNTAIARILVVSDGAVEKHVRSILGKLGLPISGDDHRRVLAVLAWLEER